VVMQLGNWSSAPHQLTMGPPQGLPALTGPSQCIYTSSKVFTLVDDRLIYKTSMDSQQGAKAEQQLNTYPRGAKILAV